MGKQTVNDLVEFDCPFRVTEDGRVETGPFAGVHAPPVYHDDESDVIFEGDEWWAWSRGYTGQYMSRGSAVMHASESIGGRMERELLAEPGMYVVTAVECLPDDENPEPEPAGWIVLKREEN